MPFGLFGLQTNETSDLWDFAALFAPARDADNPYSPKVGDSVKNVFSFPLSATEQNTRIISIDPFPTHISSAFRLNVEAIRLFNSA
jgi:hypothetical protein